MAVRRVRDLTVFVTDIFGITARRIDGAETGIGFKDKCVAVDVPGGPFFILTADQWDDFVKTIRDRPWSQVKGK